MFHNNKYLLLIVAFATLISFVFSQSARQTYSDMAENFISEKSAEITPEEALEVRQLGVKLDFLSRQSANQLFALPEERGPFSCLSLHGNFCGPGFCDNAFWDGCKNSKGDMKRCNFNGSAKNNVDKCCRVHDRCCVESRANGKCKHCESAMAHCLSNAKTNSLGESFAKNTMKIFFENRPGCC